MTPSSVKFVPGGTLLSRYRLQRPLGRTPTRPVWLADDLLLRRTIVIKAVTLEASFSERQALHDEFQLLRTLRHPRLPRVLDLHISPNLPDALLPGLEFFTQHWLEGPSLAARLPSPLTTHQTPLQGSLPPDVLRQCLVETLELLCFLHHQGLTRLDLKPEHLIRTACGWSLIDLGQVRAVDALADLELHGSLAWLAPEMMGGGTGSPQADLYSLGATFYEALTGTPPPLEGRTLAELAAYLHRTAPPPVPLHLRARDPVLATLLTQLLARDPAQRPVSAEAALNTLDRDAALTWKQRAPLPQAPLTDSDAFTPDLKRRMEETLSTQGGSFGLIGPRGSGRSRMLKRLADTSAQRGRVVLRLEPGTLPAVPWATADLLLRHLESLAGGAERPHAPPSASHASPVDAYELRLRGFISRLLPLARRAADRARSPLLVLIDDLMEVDEGSRALLERLVPYLPESGLILGVVLPQDIHTVPGKDAFPWNDAAFPLVPWTADAVRAHAETVLGAGCIASPASLEQLIRVTGGWPGPVREVLEQHWHSPATAHTLGAWMNWHPPDEQARVARLEAVLPAEVLEQVRYASIFPEPFTASAWADGADCEIKTLAGTPLVNLGVLEPLSSSLSGEALWRFQDEQTRRAIEHTLSDSARVQAHRRMVAHLQERALEESVPARRLAWHFLRADQPEGAKSALQRALTEALDAGAYEEAVRCVQSLLELLPAQSRARSGLLARKGELLHALHRFGEAESAFLEALPKPKSGEAASLEPRHAPWLAGLGKARVYQGRLQEAIEPLQQALELYASPHHTSPHHAGPHDSLLERIPCHHLLCWILSEDGQLQLAEHQLQQAQALGPPEKSPLWIEQQYLEVMLQDRQGHRGEELLKQLEGALVVASKGRDVRGELKHERGELKLLSLRASIYRKRGRPELVLADLEALAERSHARYALDYEAAALGNQGEVFRDLGKLEQAVKAYHRAAILYGQLGNLRRVALNHLEAALVLHQLRRPEPAHRTLEQARALAIKTQDVELLERVEQASLRVSSLHPHRSPQGTTRDDPRPPLQVASTMLRYLSQVLVEAQDERTLAAGLADMVGRIVGGRCLIFLLEQGQPVIIQGDAEVLGQARDISRTILQEVGRTGQAYRMADVLELTEAGRLKSLRGSAVRSVHCLPLIRLGQCVGAIYVDHPTPSAVTDDETTGVLQQAAQLALQLLAHLVQRQSTSPLSGAFAQLGSSPVMQSLATRLERLLGFDTLPMIMLLGETGVGKSWLARQIHLARGGLPERFVSINCAAVAEGIFEAEFFGATHYDRTGKPVVGYFDVARGGTLFLDEIGELPLPLQAKLLTVLSEREYRVVGSKERRSLECALMFATNQDLMRRVEQGTFRRDLLERIQDVQYWVPSLRERGPEDILLLTRRCLQRVLETAEVDLDAYFTPSALRRLQLHPWPGNVRQLEKLLCHHPDITALLKSHQRIDVESLENALRRDNHRENHRENHGASDSTSPSPLHALVTLEPGKSMQEVREQLETLKGWYAARELQLYEGNKSETARRLGISRSNLDALLKQWPEPVARPGIKGVCG